MYAIVKTGGKQYRVEQGQTLLVERLPAPEGATVTLEPLLLRSDDTIFDAEGLAKVEVQATIVGHLRGKKLRVFKFKPKRGYRRRTGHRQELTRIEVTSIGTRTSARAAAKPAAEPKAVAQPAATPAPKAAARPKPAAAAKPAPAGKPAPASAERLATPAAAPEPVGSAEAAATAKPSAARKTAGTAKPAAARRPAAKSKPAAPAEPDAAPKEENVDGS